MARHSSAMAAFQQAFARHLRSPSQVRLPAGVPRRPAKIYQELFFNNICGYVDGCFPVARSLIPAVRWRALCRSFFRDHSSHTPYFSEIPGQFVRFVETHAHALRLPAWMPELLDYEWIELAVDTDSHEPVPDNGRRIRVNPTLRNLHYHWPVHRISRGYRPRKPVETHLLVYRDMDARVRFMEVNAISAALIAVISEGPKTADDALTQLAKQLGQANPEALKIHGRLLLAELIQKTVLTGKLT